MSNRREQHRARKSSYHRQLHVRVDTMNMHETHSTPAEAPDRFSAVPYRQPPQLSSSLRVSMH